MMYWLPESLVSLRTSASSLSSNQSITLCEGYEHEGKKQEKTAPVNVNNEFNELNQFLYYIRFNSVNSLLYPMRDLMFFNVAISSRKSLVKAK